VQLLGGHQRKAGVQIEAHLVAKDAHRAGAGAIALRSTVLTDVAQKIEILAHYAFTALKLPVGALRR